MTLTEEERKKIEEEEYRKEVKGQFSLRDEPKKKKGVGCFTAIIVVVVSIGIFGAIISSQVPSIKNTSPQETTPKEELPEAISEEYKTSLANSFCQNRSDGEPYFDLQPVAQYFEDQKDTDKLIYNTTKKPLINDCKKVAEGCLKIWNKKECENLASKKIWIGMSELQLNLSWGNPNDKNNTTGSWGIHSQWVYGADYVYLEGEDKDSMKVTSWQD